MTINKAGETVFWGDGLKVTAYAYKQPVPAGAPKPAAGDGYVWGAVDVQVCVSADGDISNRAWLLRYADHVPSAAEYQAVRCAVQPSGHPARHLGHRLAARRHGSIWGRAP